MGTPRRGRHATTRSTRRGRSRRSPACRCRDADRNPGSRRAFRRDAAANSVRRWRRRRGNSSRQPWTAWTRPRAAQRIGDALAAQHQLGRRQGAVGAGLCSRPRSLINRGLDVERIAPGQRPGVRRPMARILRRKRVTQDGRIVLRVRNWRPASEIVARNSR